MVWGLDNDDWIGEVGVLVAQLSLALFTCSDVNNRDARKLYQSQRNAISRKHW